jgi:ABC-2 type transport system permease protein
MIALVFTELQKLKGSLALLVAVAAPALPGLLVMLALLSNDRAASWTDTYRFALPLWALFLAPMVIAAFTALTAQIEHRGHGWDHLLSLPIARWRIFAAKIIVTFAAFAVMTALVLGFASLGTLLGGAMGPGVPEEAFPWAKLMEQGALMTASMTTLVAIQLWVALRFANFVVPLVVGIGGTLVALAVRITRTQQADWFPWVLPFNTLVMPTPERYAMVGLFIGMAILAAMAPALARHQFR